MIRIGTVTKKEETGVRVCFDKLSACAGCSGCGQDKKTTEILVRGGMGEVGDRVSVRIPDGKVLPISMLVYIVPLIFLMVGLVLGNTLSQGKEGMMLLSGILLMLISFALIKAVDITLGKKEGWHPQVVEVNPEVEQEDSFICTQMSQR